MRSPPSTQRTQADRPCVAHCFSPAKTRRIPTRVMLISGSSANAGVLGLYNVRPTQLTWVNGCHLLPLSSESATWPSTRAGARAHPGACRTARLRPYNEAVGAHNTVVMDIALARLRYLSSNSRTACSRVALSAETAPANSWTRSSSSMACRVANSMSMSSPCGYTTRTDDSIVHSSSSKMRFIPKLKAAPDSCSASAYHSIRRPLPLPVSYEYSSRRCCLDIQQGWDTSLKPGVFLNQLAKLEKASLTLTRGTSAQSCRCGAPWARHSRCFPTTVVARSLDSARFRLDLWQLRYH